MEPSMIGGEERFGGASPAEEAKHSSDSTMDDEDSFLDELEPRGRCYTWPVPQFGVGPAPLGSMQTQQPQHLVAGSSASSSRFESLSALIGGSASPIVEEPHLIAQQNSYFAGSSGCFLSQPHLSQQQPHSSSQDGVELPATKAKPKRIRRRTADSAGGIAQPNKKPNPWGEESYSDLIARALSCANNGRLKLNEIYQWFSENIPYFAQRSSQEEAQGWKNSIRHNLSLHSRFMRIQNEGAGKSSWWVINPDAKPGRNPRRRANTMEAATKTAIDKKRRGARKRVENVVQQKGNGGQCSSSMASMLSSQQDLFPGEETAEMSMNPIAPIGPNFDTFRPRAQSTLSITGGPPSSCLSPPLESSGFDDFHFPSWMDEQAGTMQKAQNGGRGGQRGQPNKNGGQTSTHQVNELLVDRTDQMKLEVAEQKRMLNGIKMEIGMPRVSPSSSTAPLPTSNNITPLLVPKNEVMDPASIKQEPTIPAPPSYQELSAVRRPVQLQTNPLLRQLGGTSPNNMMQGGSPQLKPGQSMSSTSQPPPSSIFNAHTFTSANLQQQMNAGWLAGGPGQSLTHASLGQFITQTSNGPLPLDLENVNAMSVDQTLLGDLDVDAVLRHEMAQGGQFDLP